LFVAWTSLLNSCPKCYNPSLGLVTKARACKVAGQEGSPRVTSHSPRSAKKCEGMNPHTPKEPPFWELESQWTSEFSKGDCRGQNPVDWRVLYIIGKLLKRRYLKWACMTHLNIKYTIRGRVVASPKSGPWWVLCVRVARGLS
jgi:hypothetical protein